MDQRELAIKLLISGETEGKMKKEKGFTLVELLVAMGISVVVMAGVYSVYFSQQKSYMAQEQIVAMQQNLRAGMTILSMDIMSAGYDPIGGSPLGLNGTGQNFLDFSLYDEASGTTKQIQYSYDLKSGVTSLLRSENGGTWVPVAENIDWLNFVYLDANQGVAATAAEVRSIQVTMVARTGRGDRGYVDTKIYPNKQGSASFGPKNDNFRRMVLSREIQCRNLGM
jgi:type IV pilus assembly protein PilW